MGFFSGIGDFVSGIFDSAKSIVKGIVDTVKSAVKFVVDVIVEIVKFVGEIIKKVIKFIKDYILIIIAVVVAIYTPYLLSLLAKTWPATQALILSVKASIAAKYAKVALVVQKVWSAVAAKTAILKTVFKGFLKTIHFDTLYKIHQIAFLVSKDYHETIVKLYSNISRISESIGMPAQQLTMIYNATRTIFLDVSTTLGQTYDIAQIRWLDAFNSHMEKTAHLWTAYAENPAHLFYDLQNLVERPALDAKAGFMRSFLQTVEVTVDFLDQTAKNVEKLAGSVENFIESLPKVIRKEINPKILDVTEEIRDFINYKYEPGVAKVGAVIDIIQGKQHDTTRDLTNILKRLSLPGDYLREIDTLKHIERKDQERKISEISNRYRHDEALGFIQESSLSEMALLKTREIQDKDRPYPRWYTPEIQIPGRPALASVSPRKTWFVGDY